MTGTVRGVRRASLTYEGPAREAPGPAAGVMAVMDVAPRTPPPRRRRPPTAVLALVAALVVLLGVGTPLLLQRGDAPPPRTAAAAPSLRPATSPVLPARPPMLPGLAADADRPTTAALLATLSAGLSDPRLGGRPAVSVVDAETGAVLLSERGDVAVKPASTSKLVTAVAALTALDPQSRPLTRVLAGALPGQVVLVGGGDATLVGASSPGYPRRADLSGLASVARTALGGVPVTSVLVDDTLFQGPVIGPGWKRGYVSGGDVAPVTALMVDGGRAPGREARSLDPPVSAGLALAALLGNPAAPVTRGTAPGGARVLAETEGPTVAQQVELMLTRSDNDVAESLARQVALARGDAPTFTGAAAALRDVVAEVLAGAPGSASASSPGGGSAGTAAPLAVQDGSGLSRDSRLLPETLARLLARVADQPDGRYGPLLSGLPVAGFDGTLRRRYDGAAAPAAGVVRGKTGTLDGTSALAGLLLTADGRLLAFDLTADAVPSGANRGAEAALDALAARLVACGCR